MKSGSLRAIPGPPKFTTACGTSRWMTIRRPSSCGTTGATGLSSALAGSAPQPRDDLRAHALDRRSVEARLGEREPQIVEGFVAVFGECAQGAAQIVASGAEAELDRLALQPVVKGIGIEGPGAVVEQTRRHIGNAGFVRRVLIGAAAEGEFDGDQRQRAVAHQPSLDAERADHALDGHRSRRQGGKCDGGTGHERDQAARGRAAEGGIHERFSWAWVSLTRKPVTERRLSSQRRAASCTACALTSRMRSGQVRTCSTLAPVASAAPYHCASARWLSLA